MQSLLRLWRSSPPVYQCQGSNKRGTTGWVGPLKPADGELSYLIDQCINTAPRVLFCKSDWGGAFLTTISTQLELQLQINLACSASCTQLLTHFFLVCFMMRALWMCGITPPPAIVALINVSSSSSPLIASSKCLGVILLTLRSLEALPASSSTSAVKYSRMAAV